MKRFRLTGWNAPHPLDCVVEPAYGLDGYAGLLDAELAALDELIDGRGVGRAGERHVRQDPSPAPSIQTLPEEPSPAEEAPRWRDRILSSPPPKSQPAASRWLAASRRRLRATLSSAARIVFRPDPALAAMLEAAPRRIWFSDRRDDPTPPAIRGALPGVAWERVGLAPTPEAVAIGTVRVPLIRWNPQQMPLWGRRDVASLANDAVMGTTANRVGEVTTALSGRLPPDIRMLVAGRPRDADRTRWRECRNVGRGLWMLAGPLDLAPAAAVARAAAPVEPAARPTRVSPIRVSVVTISYNQAPFLEAALRSVLDQDYPWLEYIVIDGGSTDGSREILERYRSRLAALVIEPDNGQSDALTKGFALATGEILTWLCSDDLLEPGAVAHAAAAMSRYDVDLVAGGCRLIDASGRRTHLHHNGLPLETPVPLSFGDVAGFLGVWQKGMYFFQPDVFFTRRIWEASGGFIKHHLHYAMDYDLFLRFALAGARIVHIPRTLASSRVHSQQKTRHDNQEYLPTVRLLLREFRALISELAKTTE